MGDTAPADASTTAGHRPQTPTPDSPARVPVTTRIRRRVITRRTAAGLLTLLLAGCGGGGGAPEATVTLKGNAGDAEVTPSRVVAISLKDGRMFPGPEGARVEADGSYEIPGAPQGHRFLVRTWNGARAAEHITGRADDEDEDGAYEAGPVDTASTAAALVVGHEVAKRLDGRAHIERGEFNRHDADAIEHALEDLDPHQTDHHIRDLGHAYEHNDDLCADGELDELKHVRINAYLAARAVIRMSRKDADGDDLLAWLRTGLTGANVRVHGRVIHVDCSEQDDPDVDPGDVGEGDVTPPETSITGGPADPTSSTEAAFTFASSESGSSFECNLDGSPFAACANGKAYSALQAVSHIFQVRAIDPWGNVDGTPARFFWTVDTTAPVLSMPADATVEAPSDTSPASTGMATATDTDDPSPVVSFSDAVAAGTGQLIRTITRTWTATDAAGNSASADQVVRVMDTTAPVLTLLGSDPLTVAHDAVYADAGATALDAVDGDLTAGIVTANPVDTSVLGDFTVTYNVSDAAGNAATPVTRTVHVTDQAPPVLTLPADLTLEAPADPTPAVAGTATATDAADPAPVVTFSDAVTPGTGQVLLTVVRTWTATDAAGNSVSADQTIEVTDTTPPALTVPPDATVDALGDTSPAATGTATAMDTVDPTPVVTFSDVTIPGTGAVLFTITRTWTATDASGNSASADQLVEAWDTTPPVVTPPGDITVMATDVTGAPATEPDIAAFLAGATATDDVGVVGPITNDAPALFPPGTTVVTFSAGDAAGNVGTATAAVTVDRCGAATVTWTATTDGFWHDPANWSTGAVPGPGDIVCIDVAPDITVTHAQGTDPIDTLVAFNRVTLSGGSLGLTNPSRLANDFTLSGTGVLAGAGDLSVTGTLTWTGGTMTGTGTTVVDGAATLGGGNKILVRGLRVSAGRTATWTAGQIVFQSAGTIDNAGTFQVALPGDLGLANGGGTGAKAFNNTGTFVKTAPATGSVGATTIGAPIFFSNDGTVAVQAGELRVAGGGAHTGSFDAAAGVLAFTSDNVFQAGASLTGAGEVIFPFGTASSFQADSAYGVSGTTRIGGTVDLGTGRDVTLGTYIQTSGTLTGGDNLTVADLLTWTGGTINGTGTLVLDGDGTLGGAGMTLGRPFEVTPGGTVSWTAGSISLQPAGRFDNAGTFRAAHPGDATLSIAAAGAQVFRNTGTFLKAAPAAGSAGATIIGDSVPFDNDGTVQVQAGELRISGGGTHTGSFDAGGGTLNLASDNVFGAGAAVTGAGQVTVGVGATSTLQAAASYGVAGTTRVDGTLDLGTGQPAATGTYVQSGGTLTGPDTLTVTGPLTWTGGTMTGTGAIVADGGATLGGGLTKVLGRTFRVPVGRTASWTLGSVSFQPGGVLDNAGTFQAAHPGSASFFNAGGTGARAFNNTGTFVKLAPAAGSVGSTLVGSPVAFNNSGAVDLQAGALQFSGTAYTQTAGTTTVNGGMLVADTPIDIQGGRLLGAGTVSGPVVVSGGAVAPGLSPGKLTVSNAYTQSSGGTLEVELGGLTPVSGYDQLAVALQADLDGRLAVFLSGGFVPAVGDTFDVVTYGWRAPGTTFAAVSLPAGVTGSVTYGANMATLTVTGVDAAALAAADADPDLDGLSTTDELALGTDPGNPDTDGDNVGDGVEVLAGADPLTAEAPGKVLFVAAATGDDAASGTSWTTAKATTAAALAVAPDGAAGAPTFILHEAGTYPGGLAVGGRSGLALVGSVGPSIPYPLGGPTSVLDATGAATSVVTVDTSQDITLVGFELTGGSAVDGGGLLAVGSTPVRVFRSLVRGNTASQRGGGVYAEGGDLTLASSRVAANRALAGGGGGLYVNAGSARVEDTLFTANEAGAGGGGIGLVAPVGTVLVFNNLLVGNLAATGGAVAMTDPGAGTVLRANTMAWNRALDPAGGGALAFDNPSSGPDPTVVDNVLWHNEDSSVESSLNPGDDLAGPITDTISTHNDIGEGAVNAGTDISVDPGFTRGFFLDQARVAPAGPVDAGDLSVASLFADGQTTDAAGTPDAGQVDLGFHHASGAPAGSLTAAVDYPAPLVGLAAGQAVTITPRVDGADLGPGHRVAVRTGAGTTAGVALSAPSGLDPLFTGDSVLATDNGDGTYTVLVDTTAVATGTVTLDVYTDDDPSQLGVGATGF